LADLPTSGPDGRALSAARRLGLIVAAVTLVLDQASKLWLYFVVDIAARQPIEITSFFNLILVWNQGVSFGLFQQNSEAGRWFLFAFKLVAAVALTIWIWRAGNRVLALGLGLIVGGAIGNAIDRALYGAVLDFAHFFWGRFSWYVFNIADAAIVVGVAVLLYDSVRPQAALASKSP
jgi:signal peptidase II